MTGERGDKSLTRHGIEEYVTDCVIVLDHRVHDDISTRRLRVVKYRGSAHGTNEYPFLISARGFVVLPITSIDLDYAAPQERISTGVDRLDHMLGGGIFRGSAVLVSGTGGTGKTSLGAHLVDAACARGERALLISYEESPAQILRNMRSIGIDLQPWVDSGLLRIWAARPSTFGLEAHLAVVAQLIEEQPPSVAVLDGVTGLARGGTGPEVTATVARKFDLLKSKGITVLATALDHGDEMSMVSISSMVDTWLLLRNIETNGERNRLLFVLKSRGTAHSNQVREFVLTDHGVDLVDVYVGVAGMLTGTARLTQEAAERDAGSGRTRTGTAAGVSCTATSASTRRTSWRCRTSSTRSGRRSTGSMRGRVSRTRGRGETGGRWPHGGGPTRSRTTRTGMLTRSLLMPAGHPGMECLDEPAERLARGSRVPIPVRPGICASMSTDQSPNSVRAIENLRRLCEEHVPGRYRIEVVDLRENPRLAADDQILAVPTAVRRLPEPIRKFVGDLSDTDRLLVGLQIRVPGGAPGRTQT